MSAPVNKLWFVALALVAAQAGRAEQIVVSNYAVTTNGVYYMANSAATNPSWVNISGNLFNILHNPFGDSTLAERQLKTLTSRRS